MPCRFPDSLTPWGQRCGHREGGTPPSQHTWDTPQPAHLGPPQPVARKHTSLGEGYGTFIFTLYILKAREDGPTLSPFCHCMPLGPPPPASRSPSPSHLAGSVPFRSTRSKALPQGIPGKWGSWVPCKPWVPSSPLLRGYPTGGAEVLRSLPAPSVSPGRMLLSLQGSSPCSGPKGRLVGGSGTQHRCQESLLLSLLLSTTFLFPSQWGLLISFCPGWGGDAL